MNLAKEVKRIKTTIVCVIIFGNGYEKTFAFENCSV